MKKTVLALLGVSIFCASTMVYATSYRPYIDIGFGYAGAEDMPDNPEFENILDNPAIGAGSHNADNYGGRAVIGLLWNSEASVSYGLETGAAYYGLNKYANNEASLDLNYYGIELLGVVKFNMDKMRLTLKAGATDEQMHPTESNMSHVDIDDNNQVFPEIGLGIAYAITNNFEVGLSYYHVFGNTVSFNSVSDAENLPSINMGLIELTYFI